jgi:hypothetical protein
VDGAAALALMIALLIVTAGLGVIALLEVPAAGVVITSFVLERRRRRGSVIKKRHQTRQIEHGRR